MKSIYCFRGLRTVLDETAWNHNKYFFLSLFLFFSLCFNEVKCIQLGSTLLFKWPQCQLRTWLPGAEMPYVWVHSSPIFDKKQLWVQMWCWFGIPVDSSHAPFFPTLSQISSRANSPSWLFICNFILLETLHGNKGVLVLT